MTVCYLGIGSNLGDRQKYIRFAIARLKDLKNTSVVKVSRLYETEPVGGPAGQGKFLNGALKIRTAIPPLELLKKIKKIEKMSGRAKALKWGPRTLDIDILFYGDRIINRRGLKVPHPEVFRRDFVMRPLLEVL